MAIKGKRRRGGGRSVAAPPRPVTVIPPKPLFKRRGFRITALVVLLAGVLTLVLLGLDARSDSRAREEEVRQIRQFGVQVQTALTAEGAAQELATGFLILPELGQAVADLQSEEIRPKRLEELAASASEWVELTTAAATGVAGVATENLVLFDGRTTMQQALLLYANVARMVGVAAELGPDGRTGLANSLSQSLGIASAVFDGGWQKIVGERTRVGLPSSLQEEPPG